MRKILIFTLFFLLSANTVLLPSTMKDSLVIALNKAMGNKDTYINQKEQRIHTFKQMQLSTHNDPSLEYNINQNLYKEYVKYSSDSALHYLKKNCAIANILDNQHLKDETAIQIALMYSTIGLFVESKNMLDSINPKKLSKDLLSLYYETFGYYYDHYGQSNDDHTYFKKSDLYRDSLLQSLSDTFSLKYKMVKAEKSIYYGGADRAEKTLLSLLATTTDENPERAVIAYLIGAINKQKGNEDLQLQYFMMSAITDITNVIKDNASLQSLAITYSDMGDIDSAYKYMKFAMEDAISCNVRYRASEALASYPIINASYQAKEQKQKEKLRSYLILISILTIFLIVAIIYVYKQMKRVSKIRKELYQTNIKLIELNENMASANQQLHEANDQLSDANHIKEEYIAHFFDLCSDYINKMEDYRKSLNKLAGKNLISELFKMLKSTSFVDNELELLYKKFDKIFLSLYPTFVDEFNSLLVKEEQVELRSGELMNTELRVFALIRLGITDSAKIAEFLRYSLSTIYNYRTKARNKAAVSRNEFEERVIRIGIINKNKQ